MAYGKKYQIDFDSLPGEEYHLEIHKKDYVGSVLNRIGGATPVLHKWSTDDPKAPIKGAALDIELINENGNLPLSDFFSVEDDTFLVKFFHGTDLKFIGYLVQDDCNEEKLDFTHLIKLSATDNLGLLKDVDLSEAARLVGVTNTYTGDVEGIVFLSGWIWRLEGLPAVTVNDTIIFTGTPHDGTYKIIHIIINAGDTFVFTEPTLTGAFSTVAAGYTTITPTPINRRMTLAELINLCLYATNLILECNVYSKIFPTGGATERWLEDTYIDGTTFLQGETYDSCYKVLEAIMKRFRASLFQANGVWNIVRWDELRQYGNAIEGFKYDSDMVYDSDITLSDVFNAGIGEGTIAETVLTESIIRPYKFVKETFNYRQPSQLMKNIDFSKLGPLITSYADGPNMVYEYGMADWEVGYDYTTGGNGYVASSGTRFIRVIKNANDEEIERFGVIKGNSGFSDFSVAQSNGVEVSEGDRIQLSGEIRTSRSQAGPGYMTLIVQIVTTNPPTPRSANNRRLNGEGKWFAFGAPQPPGIAWSVYIPSGENSNQWHSFENGFTEGIPHAGLLTFKLAQHSGGTDPNRETHYKNMRFEIKQSIAGQGGVIGHTHTDTQPPTINNKQAEEIEVDDSPSNSIAGTLFLESFTGALQDRTKTWQRGAVTTEYRLGQITTFDELFYRRLQRSKLEGALRGLIQTNHLSLLTLIRYNYFTDTNFVWGQCEIDYKNDKVRGTLLEMYKDTEDDMDLSEIYVFKYLYEKK